MLKPLLLLVALFPLDSYLAAAEEQAAPARTAANTTDRRSFEAKPDAASPSAARRGVKRNTAATPAAQATPVPEKRGFFRRLFGRRTKPVPQATPPPSTPKPVTRHARRPRAESGTDSQATTEGTERKADTKGHEKVASDQPTEAETKGAAARQAESAPSSAAAITKKRAGQRTSAAKATPPAELTTPEAQEKWKYDETRKKALEDEEVRKLKEKANTAPNEEEGRRALRAYNKALFNKMRSLDPSIKDRIDAMEAGVMKRLGE